MSEMLASISGDCKRAEGAALQMLGLSCDSPKGVKYTHVSHLSQK